MMRSDAMPGGYRLVPHRSTMVLLLESEGATSVKTNESAVRRPAFQMAPPGVLEGAYPDPGQVLALIEKGAPYKSITAVQKEPEGTRAAPWFRNFWALGGNVIFPGAEAVFHNPNFIAAARETFSAQIVLPLAMMTNLNAPAPAAPPHLDLPFFRGAHKREVPLWLLAPMGYSGLFQHWAIPVASVITWFYDGPGGEFEYWPDGLAAPSQVAANLSSNEGVIADNEYMYHRVCQIGEPDEYLPDNQIPFEAMLERSESGWQITAGDDVLGSYPAGGIRASVLWKAYCFRDQAEADAFTNGTDNLTPGQIVDIFQADLRRRGIHTDAPDNLDGKDRWSGIIRDTYPAAGY